MHWAWQTFWPPGWLPLWPIWQQEPAKSAQSQRILTAVLLAVVLPFACSTTRRVVTSWKLPSQADMTVPAESWHHNAHTVSANKCCLHTFATHCAAFLCDRIIGSAIYRPSILHWVACNKHFWFGLRAPPTTRRMRNVHTCVYGGRTLAPLRRQVSRLNKFAEKSGSTF